MAYVKVKGPPERTFKNGYLVTTLKGVIETSLTFFKQLFQLEKRSTVEFPEQIYQYSERFKGRHFLTKRPDGQVRCTACFLCATNCPAQCITIVAGESVDKGIEKFPLRFEIDMLRCVFCGYCEEACPVDAIRLGPEYPLAGLSGEQKWSYEKDYLLDREAIKAQVGVKQVSRKPENTKDKSVPSQLPGIYG